MQRELSVAISPYREFQDFTITVTIDGDPLALAQISESIREGAQVRYRLDFDAGVLTTNGRVRLSYLRPDRREELLLFRRLVEEDNGSRLFAFLAERKEAAELKLARSKDPAYFVEFSTTTRLDELPGVQLVPPAPSNRELAPADGIDLPSENAPPDTNSKPRNVTSQPPTMRAANPGPFVAEIDAFELAEESDAGSRKIPISSRSSWPRSSRP